MTHIDERADSDTRSDLRWRAATRDWVENICYAALSAFAIYVVLGGGFSPVVQRAIPVALMFLIVLLGTLHPHTSPVHALHGAQGDPASGSEVGFDVGPKYRRIRAHLLRVVPIIVGLCAVGGIVATLYPAVFQDALISRAGQPTPADTVISVAGISCLLVVAWVRIGAGLAIFGVAGLAYVLFGQYLPAPFGHIGFSLERTANYIWISTAGVFGSLLGIITSIVLIFIVFGAFLEISGAGKFFIDFASGIGRRLRSGPAQAAIISSGFMGMINGSAVANVASTGNLTIPLMKRMRYRGEFAGAVESSAGVVGQILPPVMGSAAFLMAQTTGISYATIATVAIIPAVLFLGSIGIAAHLQAVKSGIGISERERRAMPTVGQALRTGGFFVLPIVVLIWLLYGGRSPSYAGAAAMAVIVIIMMVRTRGSGLLRSLWRALIVGGRNSVPILLAIATVGVVLGSLQVSGLGNRLSQLILQLGGGSVVITLIITMMASLVLGIGLPTSATYLLLAVTVAPALVQLGVGVIQAHLFILYFGALSDLTPPVAVSPYVAAGIAKANPMATSMRAFLLSVPAFLLPNGFVLDSALIGRGSPIEVITAVVCAICGIVAFAGGGMGYLAGRARWWERALLLVGGASLIVPNPYVRLCGVAVLLVAIVRPLLQRLSTRKGASGP